jgi:hypothetical protein
MSSSYKITKGVYIKTNALVRLSLEPNYSLSFYEDDKSVFQRYLRVCSMYTVDHYFVHVRT